MPKHDLVAAYKAAQKQAHVREFEVAGKTIELPRLSLKRQAELETLIRKTIPNFSLSTVRNRAAIAMVSCVEEARQELIKKGMPEKFKDAEEAAQWEDKLQVAVLSHWGPFADELFSKIKREHMIRGVALALHQRYAKDFEKQGLDPDDINDDFVDELLAGDNGNLLETMFLWATGLAGMPEETKEEPPKTADELVKQELGGTPKGSKTQRGGKKTTTTTSPSSKQSTESTPGN